MWSLYKDHDGHLKIILIRNLVIITLFIHSIPLLPGTEIKSPRAFRLTMDYQVSVKTRPRVCITRPGKLYSDAK